MRALLLNQGYQAVGAVSWQKAICLILLEKAELIEAYENKSIRTISEEFPVPAVVRLYNYNKLGPVSIRFSRENVYIRDKHHCQYCGYSFSVKKLTLDHVVPRARGGRTVWTNIITACKDCNVKKADRTPNEANMPLLSKPTVPTSRHPKSKAYLNRGIIPKEWNNFLHH